MTPAVSIKGISKAYRLGRSKRDYPTFREAMVHAAGAPLRRIRELRGEPPADETFWALKDVSFDVEPGAVVGIIGRNGAGKSTLLKILSRITEPTAGEIRIQGRVASLLEVGTGFHPELSGRENIYLNGAILGMRRAEIARKFDEIVAFAETEKFLDTPVKRYSSGMYVRLAFAVAAHLEPEILIVDEVLSVGDAEFQKKCLGKMQEVAQGGGRTVLFVSHNMAAVESLCTSGIVLAGGKKLLAGSAAECVSMYLSHGGTAASLKESVSGGGFTLLSFTATSDGKAGLRTFAPCDFHIRYRAERACRTAAVVWIENTRGDLVIGLHSTDFVPAVSARGGEEVECHFRVESLPLIPGIYRAHVTLRNDTTFKPWECPTTLELHIPEAEVYGSRRAEQRWHGTTAVRAAATLRPGSPVVDGSLLEPTDTPLSVQ